MDNITTKKYVRFLKLPRDYYLCYSSNELTTWDKDLYLENPVGHHIKVNRTVGTHGLMNKAVINEDIEEDIIKAIELHYDRGYVEVNRTVVKNWTIVDAIRMGIRRIFIESNVTGYSDNPIKYWDGQIGYDFPERIPAYVKKAVAKHFELPLQNNQLSN